jgi:hypothetical protein
VIQQILHPPAEQIRSITRCKSLIFISHRHQEGFFVFIFLDLAQSSASAASVHFRCRTAALSSAISFHWDSAYETMAAPRNSAAHSQLTAAATETVLGTDAAGCGVSIIPVCRPVLTMQAGLYISIVETFLEETNGEE